MPATTFDPSTRRRLGRNQKDAANSYVQTRNDMQRIITHSERSRGPSAHVVMSASAIRF
jgi:hypothetical protein